MESSSLTVVSNAVGSLWNFSAKSPEDQEELISKGAIPLLEGLTQSKHNSIAKCAARTLHNLNRNGSRTDSRSGSRSESRSSSGPSLEARRRKNLAVQDLEDRLLNETQETESEDEQVQFAEDQSQYRNGARARQPLQLGQSNKQMFVKERDESVKANNVPFADYQFYNGHQQQPLINNFVQDRGHFSSFGSSNEVIVMSASRLEPFQLNSDKEFQGYRHEGNSHFESSGASFSQENSSFSNENATFSQQNHDENDDMEEKPRDFSAQFGEEDQDEDETEMMSKSDDKTCKENDGTESEQMDRVKTFCTEETPCETPFGFSTATSFSDLHDVDLEQEITKKEMMKNMKPVSDSDLYAPPMQQPMRSDTPSDNPKVFNTEDTPGFFSRADSEHSFQLEDEVDEDTTEVVNFASNNEMAQEEKGQLEALSSKDDSGFLAPRPKPAAKSVTFNPHETPLMGSRVSSMETLSSVGQLQSCYSSCNISHMPSGIVSPSALPDSPGGITPPPRRKITNSDTFERPNFSSEMPTRIVEESSESGDSKSKDDVKVYNEEGTPAHFSSKTSWSQLHFSDSEDEQEQLVQKKDVRIIVIYCSN